MADTHGINENVSVLPSCSLSIEIRNKSHERFLNGMFENVKKERMSIEVSLYSVFEKCKFARFIGYYVRCVYLHLYAFIGQTVVLEHCRPSVESLRCVPSLRWMRHRIRRTRGQHRRRCRTNRVRGRHGGVVAPPRR